MTAGMWIAVVAVLVLGFAVLVVALLRAASRTSRREETIRRCGGRAVPAHIATERGKPVARAGYLVAARGVERVS